jgi:phage terminase large subunit-like protein
MLTMLVPFLAALACAVPPDRAMPSPERPRYVVDVRVTRPFRSVTGALTVTFTPNRTTSRLVFRLWANGPLQQAEGARLDAGPVTSAGAALPTT